MRRLRPASSSAASVAGSRCTRARSGARCTWLKSCVQRSIWRRAAKADSTAGEGELRPRPLRVELPGWHERAASSALIVKGWKRKYESYKTKQYALVRGCNDVGCHRDQLYRPHRAVGRGAQDPVRVPFKPGADGRGAVGVLLVVCAVAAAGRFPGRQVRPEKDTGPGG